MKSVYFLFILLLCSLLSKVGIAQSSTANGYIQEGSRLTFVFNEKDYDITKTPNRVVVTGAFREWSQDMESTKWQLTFIQSGRWELTIDNTEFRQVAAGSPFKFRINDGTWLSPPSTASNEEGGNLIYMPETQPFRLIGDIENERTIWAYLEGVENRSTQAKDWKLTRFDGVEIPIAEVLPNTASKLLIKPEQTIDPNRVHYLSYLPANEQVMCRFDSYFNDLYSDKDLGAIVSSDRNETVFRLFAPRAEAVKLYLYADKKAEKEESSHALERDSEGVWEVKLPINAYKMWYDFSVHGPADEPGSHYFEQTGTHVSDPYALVNDDAFGKSRVWYRFSNPPKALENGIPPMEEVVAYEVHVQDFTDLLPVDENIKGRFPAMIKSGLKNKAGYPIGFDHLVDLGINTVHLMPVQEYLHYEDDEWQAAFKNDPFMIEQDIHLENYQWGYRITHAMAVENRFRTKGSEHGTERNELRALVEAFHEKGLAVIVDYVFNHTGENMDGRHYNMNFNGIDKHYFYRLDGEGDHIGAFGNETKSENRPMMQRWIIDQCKYFIEEFGVDGFRIDLAGQTDEQTLIKLREAIGHDKIVYGEPWIGSNDPDYESNPDWDWYKIDSPITFFQDESRNAYKGAPSNPTNKLTDRGFAGGKMDERMKVVQGLANAYDEEPTPNAGITYLDIHDNWALADRFALENWDGRRGVDAARMKIATTLLFTSAGPIVLHGGTEMLRSKALAELKEQVKETSSGKLYFHGKNDSYNLRAANRFVWENLKPNTHPDYLAMLDWWKGIIAFRNSEFGELFHIGEAVPEGHYQFITPDHNEGLLAYTVGNKVAVAINASTKEDLLELTLPKGNWQLIATEIDFNLKGIDSNLVQGEQNQRLNMPEASLKIWVKRD